MLEDELWMEKALEQARKAYKIDETPIGAVIVYNKQIIGEGYNRRNTDKNALAHAEIIAIDKACKKMGDWRLEDCIMYVTLEPCPMCAGAIVQARIPRVVYGSPSPKAGFAGSVMNILQLEMLNHQCEVVAGVQEEASTLLLKQYFKQLREKKGNKTSIDRS